MNETGALWLMPFSYEPLPRASFLRPLYSHNKDDLLLLPPLFLSYSLCTTDEMQLAIARAREREREEGGRGREKEGCTSVNFHNKFSNRGYLQKCNNTNTCPVTPFGAGISPSINNVYYCAILSRNDIRFHFSQI